MLNFCDFIQVYIFTTNHHLNDCFVFTVYYQIAYLCCQPTLCKKGRRPKIWSTGIPITVSDTTVNVFDRTDTAVDCIGR